MMQKRLGERAGWGRGREGGRERNVQTDTDRQRKKARDVVKEATGKKTKRTKREKGERGGGGGGGGGSGSEGEAEGRGGGRGVGVGVVL